MAQPCVLKTLLFSVFLFFYQQGVANDTYGLEDFLKHQKESGEPPSKKQKRTDQLTMSPQPNISPLENIRIGFARLNLESDDLSGDDRLETCENYEVTEQGFEHLYSFYLNYVNTGDPQGREVRIERMLRLLHRMFAININTTHGKSEAERRLIKQMAESLFEQFFWSEEINGRSNPYYDYFYLYPKEHEPNYAGVNHGLALMLVAFLGPHLFHKDELYRHFSSLYNLYTGASYDQAFGNGLLSENINDYHSPQSVANELNAAGLDAETALLIGLAAMASAAFQRMNSGLESQETLETLLTRCLPYELLIVVYNNIARHCRPERSYSVPGVMYTVTGMKEFTHTIVSIGPISALPESSLPEDLHFLMDYVERFDRSGSESDTSFGESDPEDPDPSIVIQQQNELIAQLKQEIANQTATEEEGAVGGITGVTKKCGVCERPLEVVIMGFENCEHIGLCQVCIERLIDEKSGCPYCRVESDSYKEHVDVSR
ncbi:RING finger protein [Endozoicomonas sp. 4G]|uniref:RING finger protein n=1 Tax=Endozoicomonas sp. 4G TaxID=2872754 RepID=UPI0020784C1A|nr:RING finger protein [Endozoicomonas sp. 4G]